MTDHDSTDQSQLSNLIPRHLSKQEFGKRLYKLMLERGWHQSELARQSGLPRDSISVYVRGKSLPTPTSLQALARAFGVQPHPDRHDVAAAQGEHPIDAARLEHPRYTSGNAIGGKLHHDGPLLEVERRVHLNVQALGLSTPIAGRSV